MWLLLFFLSFRLCFTARALNEIKTKHIKSDLASFFDTAQWLTQVKHICRSDSFISSLIRVSVIVLDKFPTENKIADWKCSHTNTHETEITHTRTTENLKLQQNARTPTPLRGRCCVKIVCIYVKLCRQFIAKWNDRINNMDVCGILLKPQPVMCCSSSSSRCCAHIQSFVIAQLIWFLSFSHVLQVFAFVSSTSHKTSVFKTHCFK